jgi:antitoxin component YwqK of YwqJK toxin-antitoxin module
MKTSCFILLLLIPLSGILAQKKERKKETFAFNLNSKDYTAKFDVLADKEDFRPHQNLTYYWYSTNKVLETKGGYDGKLLHGKYAAFYLNNNLKEKGEFKKGVKNGKWVSWYDNGLINETCEWKNGMKEGHFESFDLIGRPLLEANFRKGRLNGVMKSYTDGKVSHVSRYKNDQERVSRTSKAKKEKVSASSIKTKEKGKGPFFFKWMGRNKKKRENVSGPSGKKEQKSKWHFFRKNKAVPGGNIQSTLKSN